MKSSTPNRFAAFGPDGELIALVADGLPDWPADITALTDEQLAEYETAALAELQPIRDAVAADPAYEFDVDNATQLTERIGAVRTEAARRFGALQAELDELAALSDDDRAAVVAYAAGTPAPAADDAAARAAALAGLDGLDAPAPSDAATALLAQGTDPLAIARVAGEAAGEAAAAATVAAMAPLVDSVTTGMREVAQAVRPAGARGASGRGLGAYAPPSTDPAHGGTDGQDPHPGRGTLVASADVPNMPMGTEFAGMHGSRGLVDSFIRRHNALGRSSGVEGERIPVGQFQLADHLPSTRDLRGITDATELKRRVMEVVGPQALGINPWTGEEAPIGRGGIIVPDGATQIALTASGGLAAPVEPYYPQLVLAEASRIVAGTMASFVAERGGIRGVTPATIGSLAAAVPPGYFTDGHATTNTAFTSASAAFGAQDVGKPIVNGVDGTGPIAPGTIIESVTNATTLVLSQATTGTATGVPFYLPARNPNNLGPAVGVVSAAQDAAGPPNTVKYTYDVPNGEQYEFDVYSVYTSLQFGNLTARTFPEQVEAAILLGNALAARTAEQQMLDVITNYSTLFTGAKTFGTARQLLAQWDHEAAYYRNHNRMDPTAVVRLLAPAWCLNAMRSDFLSSLLGGGAAGLHGLSDEELGQFFMERNILPAFYMDGPSDISQLFPTPGSGAINTGTNDATPIPIPDYPGSGSDDSFRTEVVSFMWGEGTWLNLTTGELNLGLVRDSLLNSQNKFRNFEEVWETPAFVGNETLRCVHTVAADGSYGSAVSVTLGAGNGL